MTRHATSPTKAELERTLLEQFEQTERERQKAGEKLFRLVKDLVEDSGVDMHSVTHRLKDRDSFRRKIAKPDKHYRSLDQITDLIGIRITTYFDDGVDQIAELIENEFSLDHENSIDKRIRHDPDRFGYMSLHYVVSISADRSQQREYKVCVGHKTEIQIRSILQHTWAEIEHDLGYKSEVSVPRILQRQFCQLAGLLEIADSRFVQIREGLKTYRQELPKHIREKPREVLIDKVSLTALIESNGNIRQLDSKVAKVTGAELVQSDEFIERLVLRFKFLGYDNLDQILDLMRTFGGDISEFANKWVTQRDFKQFNAGVSLMYLLYIYLGRQGDPEKINTFARQFGLGKDVENFADLLITYCNEPNKPMQPTR